MQGGCAGRRVRDTRYLLIVCVLGGALLQDSLCFWGASGGCKRNMDHIEYLKSPPCFQILSSMKSHQKPTSIQLTKSANTWANDFISTPRNT